MVLTAPLDLETLLIANFAGSAQIFIFVFCIIMTIMAAKFRMPNGVAIPMFAIFVFIMMGTALAGTFTGIFVIVLILAVFWLYFALAKSFN